MGRQHARHALRRERDSGRARHPGAAVPRQADRGGGRRRRAAAREVPRPGNADGSRDPPRTTSPLFEGRGRSGAVWFRVPQQGRAGAARCRRALPTGPGGSCGGARRARGRQRRRARTERQRAVCSAGVQDRNRPGRGSVDVHTRVLGCAEDRRHRLQPGEADERGSGGRHRGRRRAAVGHDWRQPHGRGARHRVRAHGVPGARDCRGHRAEDGRRSGAPRHGTGGADARGSHVPRAHGLRIRPDDHQWHGRAAPDDHRGAAETRARYRRQRRQAAGRVPRSHSQGRRAGSQIRSARCARG